MQTRQFRDLRTRGGGAGVTRAGQWWTPLTL
jgi:hypothetical protein